LGREWGRLSGWWWGRRWGREWGREWGRWWGRRWGQESSRTFVLERGLVAHVLLKGSEAGGALAGGRTAGELDATGLEVATAPIVKGMSALS
jgi:hypothetical protein